MAADVRDFFSPVLNTKTASSFHNVVDASGYFTLRAELYKKNAVSTASSGLLNKKLLSTENSSATRFSSPKKTMRGWTEIPSELYFFTKASCDSRALT